MLNRTSNLDTMEGPRQWKMDMRHGTWKVRRLCWSGALETVAEQFAVHLVDYRRSAGRSAAQNRTMLFLYGKGNG